MAKGQKRSNREAKKPKQTKPQSGGTPILAAGSASGDRAPLRGPVQTGSRNGRR